MKIVVLTSRFPFPIERGDKLRLYHQIKGLAENHDIHLIALSDHEVHEKNRQRLARFCSDVKIYHQSRMRRGFNLLKSYFTKWPFQVGVNHNLRIHKLIQQHIDKIKPDLIYCQLVRMAPYTSGLDYPKFIDYMDAYGVGMSRRAKIAQPIMRWLYRKEAKRTKQYEQDVHRLFDGHSIISNQDKELLDVNNCSVIPNGIDTDYFHITKSKPTYSIGFIGNMGYLPNIQAAEYICQVILPAYSKEYKDNLNVLIAGARPHQRVKSLSTNDINVSGWVDDIREAYSDCQILVAPLFQGTGQQNKILEAMAMGIPCVTTSEVNKAILAKDNESVLIADSAQSFVLAINRLKTDITLYNRIKENASQFVKTQYSWNASIIKLNTIFADIVNNGPKRVNKEV